MHSRLTRAEPGLTGPAALAGYALVSALFLGLPLVVERGSRYVGFGYDPQIFIWSFAWWPHAILHGENPFVTHAVWAPSGVNLAWTTTVPGLALLFSPLTLVAGPIVSYDVAAILMPALAAWTAFLLCRYLTHAIWPSLVGGYLFGFSSYVLAQGGEGHLHLSAVFLLPLVPLLVLRFLDGELAGRALAVRLGPLLAFQALISTEVAFTLILAVVVALVLCVVLVPARRGGAVSLLPALLGSYALAGVLISPFLYFLLTGFHRGGFNEPDAYLADLVNFVVPTKITLIGGWATGVSGRFPGDTAEQDAYLGLPTLLILGLFAWERRRSPPGRFLLASLAVAVVAALGAWFTVDGWAIFTLPWELVHTLPLFDNVLTARLAVYVALVAAVAVALWTAGHRPGVLRVLLPALAALALVPNPSAGRFATRYEVPPFFTESAYRSCLGPGATVIALPVPRSGGSLLWQAESGFRFDLAGGDVGPGIPASFETPPAVRAIAEGKPAASTSAATLRALFASKRVTDVIVDPRQGSGWAAVLDRIAVPRRVGGVLLYRVDRAGPPC